MLGLTNYEIKAYLCMLKLQPSKAVDISKKSNVPYGRIYDVLNSMICKKVVSVVGSSPKIFKANRPEDTIPLLLSNLALKTKEISNKQDDIIKQLKFSPEKNENLEDVSVFFGIDAFYEFTRQFSAVAKHEKLIITSRFEAKSPIISLLKMLKRGVEARIITEKITLKNKENLKNFIKLGGQVKLCPTFGLKLGIIDKDETLLAVENPKNSGASIVIKIKSALFAKAISEFFNAKWALGKKVTLKMLK